MASEKLREGWAQPPPTSRVQQGRERHSLRPCVSPIESRGNPHRWLPYVGHKAVECSPAQDAGPFCQQAAK